MKMNYWLFLGMLLSTSLLAQTASNAPPAPPIENPAPAPAITNVPETSLTNAPAAKAPKKKSSKKKSGKKGAPKAAPKKNQTAELRTVPLMAGPAIVMASNVNVRGQAKLNSEVVTKITKGQEVTVVEEIVRNNSGPTEPSAWAKIVLPATAHGWVNSSFLKAEDKSVVPKHLKVRSGPGENYSVLGILAHGDVVKDVTVKGDWTEIEAPTNTYAYVAAQYLKQEAGGPAIAAVTTPPEPPAAPASVTENPTIATATNEPPPAPTPAPETTATTMPPTNTVAAVEEPPQPRVVQHEGIVRGMTSIQAPSHFELVSPDNGRAIDYLFTTSTNLDLRRYKGLRIVVTGEEGLDERWGNTPVLTIQKIQVVSEPTGQ